MTPISFFTKINNVILTYTLTHVGTFISMFPFSECDFFLLWYETTYYSSVKFLSTWGWGGLSALNVEMYVFSLSLYSSYMRVCNEKETSIPHMTSGMLMDRVYVGWIVCVFVCSCACACVCARARMRVYLEISAFIFIHIYGRNIEIVTCSNPLWNKDYMMEALFFFKIEYFGLNLKLMPFMFKEDEFLSQSKQLSNPVRCGKPKK